MHNNGSNRLTFPDGRPLIAEVKQVLSTVPQGPRQGFQIDVKPNVLVCHVMDGDTKLDLVLNPQQAMNLGVNLISAATLSSSGLLPAPPAEKTQAPGPEAEAEANDTIIFTD